MFFPSNCYTSSCPMITYQLLPKYNNKKLIMALTESVE